MPTINVPGIGEVFADGFAEEQTMQRILAVLASADNANSVDAQRRLADASTRAANQVFGLGKAGTVAAAATERGGREVEKGLTNAGTAGSTFARQMRVSSKNLIQSFDKLTADPFAAAKSVAAGVKDIVGSFKGDDAEVKNNTKNKKKEGLASKLLGGAAVTASTALGFMFEKLSATVQAFDKVQSTGALLGGSLIEFRINAHAARLSMAEFTNVFRNNGEAMASFGGQTLRGAREFARANKSLVDNFGLPLRQLGVSFEDMGMATAEMMQNFALSGVAVENAGIETKEFAMATANQVRLQKISAALTGRSIDRQKEAERQLRRDAAVQSAIQRLSGPTQAAIKNLIATMPQFKDVILDQIQGGRLMHKNSVMMASLAPMQTKAMQDTVEAIKSGATNAGPEFFKELAKNSPAILNEVQNQGDIASLIRFSSNSFVQFAANTFPEAQELMTASINKTVKNVMSDMERTMGEANKASQALFKLEIENRKLANSISGLTTGLLSRSGLVVDIISLATKTATSGINAINRAFGDVSRQGTLQGPGNTEVNVDSLNSSLMNMNNIQGQVTNKIKELTDQLNLIMGETTTGTSTSSNTSGGGANTGNRTLSIAAPTMEKQLAELVKQTTRTNAKMDSLTTNLT